MLGFRVTKYNPAFRSKEGLFIKDEWTSLGDLERSYPAGIFTLSDYLETEEAYVESVRRFLDASGVTILEIRDREFLDNCDSLPASLRLETTTKLSQVEKKTAVLSRELEWIVRLNLRECFWCRLSGDKGTYVHFGYDYYMYLGIGTSDFDFPPLPRGMYVEPFDSPYGTYERSN